MEEYKEEIVYSHNRNVKLIGFGNRSFTPNEVDRIQQLLKQPIQENKLQSRVVAGNDIVGYLKGEEYVTLANNIFGVGGWSFQILKLTLDINDSDNYGALKVSYTATGRVTLQDGTYKENVGAGVFNHGGGKTALHDRLHIHGNAKKSAIIDCLKRTLSMFGYALGSGLSSSSYQSDTYSDGIKKLTKQQQKAIMPPPIPLHPLPNIPNQPQPLQQQVNVNIVSNDIVIDQQVFVDTQDFQNTPNTPSPPDTHQNTGLVPVRISPSKSPGSNSSSSNVRYSPYTPPPPSNSNNTSPTTSPTNTNASNNSNSNSKLKTLSLNLKLKQFVNPPT
ncbi:RasGEF domain-containing protein [Tieghemostelium lacteum]|uniref:RasGEF domain-containing protein n=1 Tax=Tieghemostelium lacteum TaxID=361077 RepID=A0A152A6U6_TIELA|nr:RasGEF domain-containing protein [Tieghemostelium lacteum]|eukprot:KYR01959.1 RasGEF domain-containing protein [Tieghemostelium lacteum]